MENGESIPERSTEECERSAAEPQLAQPRLSVPIASNASLPLSKIPPSSLDVRSQVFRSTGADLQIVGDLSVPEIIYSADGSIQYRVEITFNNGETKYISRRYSEV